MSLIYPYLSQDTSEQYHAFKEALSTMRAFHVQCGESLMKA